MMLDGDLAELQVKNKVQEKKERPKIGFVQPKGCILKIVENFVIL